MNILYIAIAGSLGAVSRYQMSSLVHRWAGTGFPYGTLAINVIGSFLAGLIMQTSISTEIVPPGWRLALTVGFLGAFTTFSAFSYETVSYIERGSWVTAGANILANVSLSLIAVYLGISLARALFEAA